MIYTMHIQRRAAKVDVDVFTFFSYSLTRSLAAVLLVFMSDTMLFLFTVELLQCEMITIIIVVRSS